MNNLMKNGFLCLILLHSGVDGSTPILIQSNDIVAVDRSGLKGSDVMVRVGLKSESIYVQETALEVQKVINGQCKSNPQAQ